MARKILWASLALAPVTFLVDFVFHADKVVLFSMAAASLVPLAWLIGEATEHAAEHTGPGIGGFLNASFGNAPELIIALFAINSGLPEVVRGSLIGSVVSNLLLVLGFALSTQREARVDRSSLLVQLGLVGMAVLLFLVPSVPGWDGDPDRHSLWVLTAPVAIALLALYFAVTLYNLRRHHRSHQGAEEKPEAVLGAWSMRRALFWLAAATSATAVISEILVHSLDAFAQAAGLSEFFIAAVIVAIVGNAAEHGGAIVIASRGKMRLASEIAVSSAAQVALLVTPAVALLSWVVKPALPLAFRPVEIATMAASTLLVGVVVYDGCSKRWHGVLLVSAYIGVVLIYLASGNR
ncbi:MAG: calcium/proton exchanger [Actinomycetota bacterium]|nr:calcium/proton exchanger [Actinomycetota bacterium]